MNKTLIIIIVIAFLILLGISTSLDIDKLYHTSYVLPNGIVCQHYSTSFNGIEKEFYDCIDGKTYLNPEYYEVFKND